MALPPQPTNPLLTLDGINSMASSVSNASYVIPKTINTNESCLNYPQLLSFLSTNTPVPYIDEDKLTVTPDPELEVPIGQKVIYPPELEPSERLPFINKVVLVVGGSKNIGRTISSFLASQGYQTIATSRKPSAYSKAENPYLSTTPLDIRNQPSVTNFFDTVIKPIGRLDALILCSGVHWKSLIPGMDSDEMKSYFQIKPIGFHRCVVAALPYLRKNPDSRVLAFSSIAGGQNSQNAGLGLYNVVNHAVTMYTLQSNMDERLMYAMGAIENPVTYVCVTPGVILSTIGSYDHYLNTKSVPKSISDAYHVIIAAMQTSNLDAFPAEPPITVARQVYDIISARQPGFNYIVGNTEEQYGEMSLVENIQLSNQMPDIDYINTFCNPMVENMLTTSVVNYSRESLRALYVPSA